MWIYLDKNYKDNDKILYWYIYSFKQWNNYKDNDKILYWYIFLIMKIDIYIFHNINILEIIKYFDINKD